MKAKKQKLLFKAIKWIGEQCEMGWNKEEIQDLLDEFIDKHDSKKKSKFGSDKEQVKLKEEPQSKTFEFWKAIFPIGSKARVINTKAVSDSLNIGDERVVFDFYNNAVEGFENAFGVKFEDSTVARFESIEPIQEPSFKVGSLVEVVSNVCSKFNRKGIIVDIADVEHKVYFFDNGSLHFVKIENLKLIKND